MTKIWGPHIWNFIHCFCEKINEDFFIKNKISVFIFLKNILFNLPCPICSSDSRIQFQKININIIKTKNDLKKLLFYYHNYVNNKLKKRVVNINCLNAYKGYNIHKCYKNFELVFLKKYSFKLNIYSSMLVNKKYEQMKVKLWWYKYYKNFN